MKIMVELDRDQAEALLTVLRRIGPSEIAMMHEGVEWATFDRANTALRVALRVGEKKRSEPGLRASRAKKTLGPTPRGRGSRPYR
jgi:hypothetical protein